MTTSLTLGRKCLAPGDRVIVAHRDAETDPPIGSIGVVVAIEHDCIGIHVPGFSGHTLDLRLSTPEGWWMTSFDLEVFDGTA